MSNLVGNPKADIQRMSGNPAAELGYAVRKSEGMSALDPLSKVSSSVEVLAALPVAIYITDAAGRITFYNEAAVAL